MRIGIFDSGIGGMTVLAQALQCLPQEDYFYYADSDHVPYGIQEKAVVQEYIKEAAECLFRLGIKALVVACNTATSVGIVSLRDRYDFPVLGMEPAVKPALERHGRGRVLVTATPLTLREEKYQNLVARLQGQELVDELPLPELVDYAEAFKFDGDEIRKYLREKTSFLNLKEYGTVVLGCTHFPLFRKWFQEVFPADTDIIDGNEGTVKHLQTTLADAGLLSGQGHGDVRYFVSGREAKEYSRYQRYLEYLQEC